MGRWTVFGARIISVALVIFTSATYFFAMNIGIFQKENHTGGLVREQEGKKAIF